MTSAAQARSSSPSSPDATTPHGSGTGETVRQGLPADERGGLGGHRGSFCSSVVGLWSASVTRLPQWQGGHPAPGPSGAGRAHGRARLCGGRRHTPQPGEPTQSAADFMREWADRACTTLLFLRSPYSPEKRIQDVCTPRTATQSRCGQGRLPRSTARRSCRAVRKTTGEGTELPVPDPVVRQRAPSRGGWAQTGADIDMTRKNPNKRGE